MEINKAEPVEKRLRMLDFYFSTITDDVLLSGDIKMRAATLMSQNIKEFDAYHVAFAEAAKADCLLTTDKRLLNASKRLEIFVNVINPLYFMEEYKKWRQY
jgi:predicted nucleic acid-binding protein